MQPLTSGTITNTSYSVNSIAISSDDSKAIKKGSVTSWIPVISLNRDLIFIQPLMVKISSTDKDGFVATCPTFNNISAHAKTYEEALDNFKKELIQIYQNYLNVDDPDKLSDSISLSRLHMALLGKELPSKSTSNKIANSKRGEPLSYTLIHYVRKEEGEKMEKVLFSNKVVDLLESNPVEDCIYHPLENLIETKLLEFSKDVPNWIKEIYYKNLESQNYFISAGLLRCVGRLSINSIGSWAIEVATDALSRKEDVEVRESAITAFENWGEKKFIPQLEKYAETEHISWLADYTRQVIQDLAS